MRRADKEVTDFNEIAGVLHRADTIRLGLSGTPYPYVVPLSFGYAANKGRISLYIHGAFEGHKHDLLRENPHVCVEADTLFRYEKTPRGITARYESFIGFGTAHAIAGEEAARGMSLLLEHCGFAGYVCPREDTARTLMYRIDLESFSAKRDGG